MSTADSASYLATTLSIFAAQMSTELQQKPRPCKRAAVLRKYATSITSFIRRFMSILILTLISLDEPPLKNTRKLSKRFSMMILTKDTFLNKLSSSYTVLHVIGSWLTDS